MLCAFEVADIFVEPERGYMLYLVVLSTKST